MCNNSSGVWIPLGSMTTHTNKTVLEFHNVSQGEPRIFKPSMRLIVNSI